MCTVQWKLNLETLDNIMKVSQMSIQALWANKSPILQLPHVTEDMLRHFVNKKVWTLSRVKVRELTWKVRRELTL